MKSPRILVYCGINECRKFKKLVKRFDISYGIEADPELAARAQEQFEGNRNVHIVHAAVCDKAGSVTFNLHNHRPASSIGQLSDEYRQGSCNDIRPVKSVEVPSIHLYEYLRSRGVDRIDLYLSDIQGMDFTVLNTLRPLIEARRIRMIKCETERDGHSYQSYQGLPSNRQALFRELLAQDYRISSKQRVKPDWTHQDIVWKLRPKHLLGWYLKRLGLVQDDPQASRITAD